MYLATFRQKNLNQALAEWRNRQTFVPGVTWRMSSKLLINEVVSIILPVKHETSSETF